MKKWLCDLFGRGYALTAVTTPEAWAFRLATAALALATLFEVQVDFADQPKPAGLAKILDLRWIGEPGAMSWIRGVLIGAGLLSLLPHRWLGRLGLTVLALGHVLVFTFFNSQGYNHHGYQIISLLLVGQVIASFWPGPRPVADRLLWATQTVIVGVYVTSAVTKISHTKGRWVWEVPDIAVELVKSFRQKYFDGSVLGIPPGVPIPTAQWVVDNPWLARALMGGGFFLELFAFLALKNRLWAAGLGLALIGMHWAIEAMMQLSFGFNVWAVFIFLVNPVWWLLWLWRGRPPLQQA